MSTIEGGFLFPEASDIVPIELQQRHLANVLCLTCGVRLWQSDLIRHGEWHAKLEGRTP